MTHRFGLLRPMMGGLFAVVACSAPVSSPTAAPADAVSTSTTSAPKPWAWEAEVWLDAIPQVIAEEGGRGWKYFLDPHVEWDNRSIDPDSEVLRGSEVITTLAVLIPRESEASQREEAFLDRDGAVLLSRFDWSPANLNRTPLRATPAQLAQVLSPIRINGATQMVSAMAVDSWRERKESSVEPDGAEAIADAWLEVRSGTAPVESLYGPEATISDSIAGVTAEGADEIRALVQTESTTDWRDASVGGTVGDPEDRETPAIYPIAAEAGVLDSLVLVVVGDDGNGCPGALAEVLDVVDGLVVWAQRYWDLEQARRCLPPDRLPDGWWSDQSLVFDDRYVPYEDLATPTGVVTADGVEVEMINSTDALDALVQWALLRFDRAGIGLPDVRSIRFSEFDQSCHGVNGRTEFDTATADILLCYHEHDLYGDERWTHTELDCKHIILHELAHVWMRQHLDDADRTAFIEAAGLQTWIDGDVMPWKEQAREVAAETMAWGLLDEPLTMFKIGAPDVETLTAGFELLTGRLPLQPAAR